MNTHASMYRKEFPEFQYQLRIYKQIDDMWDYLESVLFGESCGKGNK